MDKFKDFISKLTGKTVIKKGDEQDFVELQPEQGKSKGAKIFVKYFILADFGDIKPVIDSLREGYTIALMKIKPLKDKDMNELKRAISKVKRTCEAIDGEIVGIDEDWIIAVPNFIEVFKGESGDEEGMSGSEENE